MVKCLNGLEASTLLIRAGINLNPPTRVFCKKFLKADYESADLGVDPTTGRRHIQLICPECNTGLADIEASQIRILREIEAESKKRFEINNEAAVRRLIASEASALPADITPQQRKIEMRRISFDAYSRVYGRERAQERLQTLYRKKGEKEAYEKETKAMVKGLEVPAKPFSEYFKQVLPSIYFSVGGLVASALLGSPLFFFGALAFGVSIMIPKPENMDSIHNEAKRIKAFYENRLKEARRKKMPPEYVRNLIEEMKAEISLEKLIQKIANDVGKMGVMRKVRGAIIAKDVLKALGFLLIMFSLATNTIIPLAGFVALILGFIAYFTFVPERLPDEEK